METLGADEAKLITELRRRFYAAYSSPEVKPQRLVVSEEEEAAYEPILVREHGWPPLVVRNDAGEMGLAFKGVPLVAGECAPQTCRCGCQRHEHESGGACTSCIHCLDFVLAASEEEMRHA